MLSEQAQAAEPGEKLQNPELKLVLSYNVTVLLSFGDPVAPCASSPSRTLAFPPLHFLLLLRANADLVAKKSSK